MKYLLKHPGMAYTLAPLAVLLTHPIIHYAIYGEYPLGSFLWMLGGVLVTTFGVLAIVYAVRKVQDFEAADAEYIIPLVLGLILPGFGVFMPMVPMWDSNAAAGWYFGVLAVSLLVAAGFHLWAVKRQKTERGFHNVVKSYVVPPSAYVVPGTTLSSRRQTHQDSSRDIYEEFFRTDNQ